MKVLWEVTWSCGTAQTCHTLSYATHFFYYPSVPFFPALFFSLQKNSTVSQLSVMTHTFIALVKEATAKSRDPNKEMLRIHIKHEQLFLMF